MTGGIGAGKSSALAILERLGAAVISTDAVVHELYRTEAVRDAVVQRFGAELAPAGVVDRGELASRVFDAGSAAEDRAWLERLLWPLVRARVADWRKRMERLEPPPRALVVEVPLLFESGGEEGYDATIAVVAQASLREQRARARGHRALAQREARQLRQEQKAARADFVVANDGDLDQLERELSSTLAMLGA